MGVGDQRFHQILKWFAAAILKTQLPSKTGALALGRRPRQSGSLVVGLKKGCSLGAARNVRKTFDIITKWGYIHGHRDILIGFSKK